MKVSPPRYLLETARGRSFRRVQRLDNYNHAQCERPYCFISREGHGDFFYKSTLISNCPLILIAFAGCVAGLVLDALTSTTNMKHRRRHRYSHPQRSIFMQVALL